MWRTRQNPRHNAGGFVISYAGERNLKTYCKPLKRGASWRSQNFGDNSTQYGPHSGNDEACNTGTPVHAAGDGVIEWAGEFDDSYHDNMFWLLDMGGNVAVLNCGDDEPTFIYAHLSTFYVRPGDRVKKGQVIALSGNSGYATTGPHLHVEAVPPGYVLNSYLLGRVNPDKYLTEYPEELIKPHATIITEENTLANFSEADLDRIIVNAIDRYTMDIRRWDGDRNQLDTFKQIRFDLAAIYNAVLGVKSEKFDVNELAKALANQLPQTDIDALVKALGEKLVNS